MALAIGALVPAVSGAALGAAIDGLGFTLTVTAGLVLVLSGPALYQMVRKRYGLMDGDDLKDQAIGACHLIRQSSQRRGNHDWEIAQRHVALGSPVYVEYLAPDGYLLRRIGRKRRKAPTDPRAVQSGVGLSG
jgi:hypothetical protein